MALLFSTMTIVDSPGPMTSVIIVFDLVYRISHEFPPGEQSLSLPNEALVIHISSLKSNK